MASIPTNILLERHDLVHLQLLLTFSYPFSDRKRYRFGRPGHPQIWTTEQSIIVHLHIYIYIVIISLACKIMNYESIQSRFADVKIQVKFTIRR